MAQYVPKFICDVSMTFSLFFSAGMELPNNQRQAVYENGSFAMTDLRKNVDEGKYMCTVQNKHGHTAHGTFHLTILSEF